MTTVKNKMALVGDLDILDIMMDINEYSKGDKLTLLQADFESSKNEIHDLGFRVCDVCDNPITDGRYNKDTEEYFCELCVKESCTEEEIETDWNDHFETDYNGGMYWTQWTE